MSEITKSLVEDSTTRKRRMDRERARDYRAQNKELYNARALASKKKNWKEYLTKNKLTNRILRLEKKTKAVMELGGKCIICGYSANIHALQIDHINGDGFIRRKENSNQWKLYNEIIKSGSNGKYQVLCANCNQIKRMEQGEHPLGRSSGNADHIAAINIAARAAVNQPIIACDEVKAVIGIEMEHSYKPLSGALDMPRFLIGVIDIYDLPSVVIIRPLTVFSINPILTRYGS